MDHTTATAPAACQICGRTYKTPKGVLSIHGFKRPGDGSINGRCAGSRHVPYSEGTDAITREIEKTTQYVQGRVDYIAELTTNPPDRLYVKQPSSTAFRDVYEYRDRPVGYVWVLNAPNLKRGSYENHMQFLYANAKRDIGHAGEYIAHLKQRLANWKAPADQLTETENEAMLPA